MGGGEEERKGVRWKGSEGRAYKAAGHFVLRETAPISTGTGRSVCSIHCLLSALWFLGKGLEAEDEGWVSCVLVVTVRQPTAERPRFDPAYDN